MHQMQNMPNMQQALLQQHPELQGVLNLAQNKGISLEQIARMMAQQKGQDINQIVNELLNVR